MTSGQLIREARRRHRLDQRALARRARTSQAAISRIERGQVSPTMETLERLLACMGERPTLSSEPLPHGNDSPRRLRAEYSGTTPGERVEHAARLSRTLTTLAGRE